MLNRDNILTIQSLRPGGANSNLFARFNMGVGTYIKNECVPDPHLSTEPDNYTGKITRYSREYLMKLADKYTQIPADLPRIDGLIVVLEENTQRNQLIEPGSVKEVVCQRNPKDAHIIDHMPSSSGTFPSSAITQGDTHTQLAKADQAYLPAQRSGLCIFDKNVRAIRSILNKLTPEKFDRLLNQMLEIITTVEVLRETVRLILQKAVLEPSYSFLYAKLSLSLSLQLPEWPSVNG